MSNIFVNKAVEELDLKEGDILFYRPEENMYELSKKSSIAKEEWAYELTSSSKFSESFLYNFIENGSLVKFIEVSELDVEDEDEIDLSDEYTQSFLSPIYRLPIWWLKLL